MKTLIGNGIPAGTLNRPTNTNSGIGALLTALSQQPVAPATAPGMAA